MVDVIQPPLFAHASQNWRDHTWVARGGRFFDRFAFSSFAPAPFRFFAACVSFLALPSNFFSHSTRI